MAEMIGLRVQEYIKDYFKDNNIIISDYIKHLLIDNINPLDYLKQQLKYHNDKSIELTNKINTIENKHIELLKRLDDIDILKIKEIKNNLKLNNVKLINCYRYFINNHKYITYLEFIDLLSLINS